MTYEEAKEKLSNMKVDFSSRESIMEYMKTLAYGIALADPYHGLIAKYNGAFVDKQG